MFKMELLEKSRQEFEERLHKDKKDFDERLQKDQKRADKFNTKMNWFFLILAFLSILGTFAQLAFPNGISQLVRLFELKTAAK